MFSPNTLPLPTPSTFATTHPHPLRLSADSNTSTNRSENASNDSSDAAQPPPRGPCKFTLLHPTQQNQQCSCQSYHHNRIARGNVCDCGHQACYHVHTLPASAPDQAPTSGLRPETEQALLARMKGLEEALKRERQNREDDLRRLQELWESDIRMLREALAPFYKTEVEMRRKLTELEDRVDRNFDEQVLLKDRFLALDEANMLIEKRMEHMEGGPKRRRIRPSTGEGDSLTNGKTATNGTRVMSSHAEERPGLSSASSRALSPQTTFAPVPEREEPRSSGILNLVDPLGPRPYTTQAPSLPLPRLMVPIRQRLVMHERQEARSSGFLALDLAEREGTGNKESVGLERAASQPRAESLASDKLSPPHYSHSNPDRSTGGRSPNFLSLLPPPQPPPGPPAYTLLGRLDKVDHGLAGQSLSRKRKQLADHLALDVLADVSMANPLIP
ncbi:hypothetical protein DV738_g1013, partial [Chaetothyriales sp. CBS 135597]